MLALAFTAAWPASRPARANPQRPIPPPPEASELLGPTTRLLGESRLRFLGLHIYDARLWVGEGFDARRFDSQALALELQYARALSGRQIAQRSLDEMRRGGPIDEAEAAAWLAFMEQTFPDVKGGDRITGTWQPAIATARFLINSRPAGARRDSRFGPRFFGIWLAAHSSQPDMRAELLRLAADGDDPLGSLRTASCGTRPCGGPAGSRGNAGPPQVALTPAGGGLGAARPWGHS